MQRVFLCAALALFAVPASAQTFQSLPTDDVWVYPFAFDQVGDGILRAWGDGVTSLAPSYPPSPAISSNWSHSYIKWNVGTIGVGNYRLSEAKLLVTQQVTGTFPSYTLAQGLANPLEARPVGANFEEETWTYADIANVPPGMTRFGTGDLSNYVSKGTPGQLGFQIAIDLLAQGDFSTYFNNAVNGNGELGLALTSMINPGGPAGATYRLYSRNSTTGLGPQLLLSYQAVPEPATLATLAALLVPAGVTAFRYNRKKRNR